MSFNGVSLLAQPVESRFVRRYEAGIQGNSRMSAVYQNDSGNCALIFKVDSTASGHLFAGFETWQLNSAFELTTKRTFGDTTQEYLDWQNEINLIPDGKNNFWYWNLCYLPSDHSYQTVFGKIDSQGDTIFERRLQGTGPYDYPETLVPLDDGSALLSQYSKYGVLQRTRVFFLDSTGVAWKVDSVNPLGTTSLHNSSYATVDSVRKEVYLPTIDFNYDVSYVYNFRPRVFVYDFQGHRLKTKNLETQLHDFYIGDLHRTHDNGFLAMASEILTDSNFNAVNRYRSAIVKLDSNLDVLWIRKFWNPKLYNNATVLYEDPKGNFYLGGVMDTSRVDSEDAYQAYLMKFSPKLDSLWLRTFVDENDPVNEIGRVPRWPAQISVLDDQSILLLVNNFPLAGKYSLLYKLDSCGFLIERCNLDSISPSPPDTLWPDPDGGMVAFPNPNDGTFSLVWDVNPGDLGTYLVTDMQGRWVRSGEVLREARPTRLSLGEVRPGIYFVQIRSQLGRIFREKVVVLH